MKRLALRVSHETRGDYYNPREPITASGLTIALRPTLHATLRLLDASTRRPVDQTCSVTPLMPHEMSVQLLEMLGRRELSPESGEVRVDGLHYFGLGLRVEVSGYGRVDVDTPTIVEAAGEPIELLLVRHGTIAVRALDPATGQPVPGAKVLVVNRKDSPKGPLPSWRVISADYDEIAGAYLVDVSVFNMVPGQDEWLSIDAEGYAPSTELSVVVNGVRVGGTSMEVLLVHP